MTFDYVGNDMYAPYKVTFVNKKGERLVAGFDSYHEAMRFARKIEHSKDCVLTSWPTER